MNRSIDLIRRRPAPFRIRTRRGVAVLLVLGMLAMTLALSYASLRGQATLAQLTENLGRGEAARLAAESGVYATLRKMSDGTWAGVATPVNANVSDSSWYEVSFATGDAQLTPADPSYGEYAYRVTITSVGYSSDPGQPSVRAIHKIEAIVQLARRQILAEPTNWSTLTDYTVHQWGNRDTTVQEPVRVSGKASIQGKILLSPQYPLTTASRDEYLAGLNGMRLAGRGDHRPFASPLIVALARQDAATLTLLTTKLGLVTVDTLGSNSAPVTHPNVVLSYKLYAGGKSYAPPILQTTYGSSLSGTAANPLVIKPNPVTNPLGIFRSRNSLGIYDNVHITGTIISDGTTPDIQVYGTNVTLQGTNLGSLEGSTQQYQLPVAIIKDDLRLHSASDVSVQGLALVYDEFELKSGAPNTKFSLTGNLFANGLSLRGRDPWTMTATDWDDDYNDFNPGLLDLVLEALFDTIRGTLGLGPTDEIFFPEYMQHVRGFVVQPTLNFTPAAAAAPKPHWHNWTQPVYQKDPLDAGLRWNLVRWVEGS